MLNECNNNCSKAYERILVENSAIKSENSSQNKPGLRKPDNQRLVPSSFGSSNSNQPSTISQMAQSKKRRRFDFEDNESSSENNSYVAN